jgi:hypothetical protein
VVQTPVAIALVPPDPPKPPPRHHGQLAAHIALGVTWGGLVGGMGHRKDQLRVLVSPSALHTNTRRFVHHAILRQSAA